ncbi:MAG: hypothetical protein J0H18_17590 [Rhizobiales bacterium]|nr:hypothetical protein [Hyphomicrobiales bacterium]OJY07177.1 MAG: hypothetical protein BGP07_16680 [Rhizobiales bacterium 63-22]
MTARYQEHRDELFAAVDDEFAESLRIFFLVGGKASPDRPPRDIEAPLRTDGRDALQPDGGSNNDWKTHLAAGKATLAIDRSAYPDLILEKGFRIVARDRPGEPAFEVLYVDSRSHRRLYAILGEKGSARTGNAP